MKYGAPEEIRTPGPLLRRQLLYPTELQAHIGAGDGNRTHATSLEGWDSTIELHPHTSILSCPLATDLHIITEQFRFVNTFF